ncbi:MAG: kelch repeat-containing protein [Bacteroidota bacterium]
MSTHALRGLTLLLVALVATACDRTFIDETTPTIEVVAPAFDTVFSSRQADLEVRASSFREIASVAVNGEAMQYQATQDVWQAPLILRDGINTFIVTAADEQGLTTSDTLVAVRTALEIRSAPFALPEPRYGHTATRLLSGDVLVTGGATNESDGGTQAAFLVDDLSGRVTALDDGLNAARIGHTATLVPDGRVFILGGSRRVGDALEGEDDLLESVEVFDPVTEAFTTVPFDGQPIRRTEHTATLYAPDDGLFIDIYGGRGDVDYLNDGTIATRDDARRFEWVEGTLVARSPSIGLDIEPISGQATAPLSDPTVLPYRNLVTGTYFLDGSADGAHWFFSYTQDEGLRDRPAPTPQLPRTQHTATAVTDGVVLLFGGDSGSPDQPAFPSELYVDAVESYYQFLPEAVPPVTRSQHTATFVGNGRILVLGGLTTAGQPSAVGYFFHLPL